VTGTEEPASAPDPAPDSRSAAQPAAQPAGQPASFRLAYVPGVTPGKWARIWAERVPDVPLELAAASAAEAAGLLRDGAADAGLVRLPIDRTGLSAIPLYTETTVVVVPKDHEVAAVDEVSVGDLADYVVLRPLDDRLEWESTPGIPAKHRPATTEDAVELVAAGVGLLIVPQSLARLHHRRDLTYRTVSDAPQSHVALSWLEERTTDLMEEFIGIVRGRTVNSSRGRGRQEQAAQTPQKTQKTQKAQKASEGTSAQAKRAGTGAQAKAARQQGGKSGSGRSQGGKRGRPRH
jgi:DNA-binding transcriptional LysR family regulator